MTTSDAMLTVEYDDGERPEFLFGNGITDGTPTEIKTFSPAKSIGVVAKNRVISRIQVIVSIGSILDYLEFVPGDGRQKWKIRLTESNIPVDLGNQWIDIPLSIEVDGGMVVNVSTSE